MIAFYIFRCGNKSVGFPFTNCLIFLPYFHFQIFDYFLQQFWVLQGGVPVTEEFTQHVGAKTRANSLFCLH